jgi:hypothetical protein
LGGAGDVVGREVKDLQQGETLETRDGLDAVVGEAEGL